MAIKQRPHASLSTALRPGLAAVALAATTFASATRRRPSSSASSASCRARRPRASACPAVNGAKVVIEAFNKGKAPAPYNKVGFGGVKIEPIYVDENGGATKQVQELRNLYDREKVDAVVGYVGSGDCLAVAPVAEEMKKFLILYDCGTPRIFEDGKYKYVFRTASHAAMDNVALARYLKARNVKAEHLQPDQPGLRLGPGLAQGLHLVDGEALPGRQGRRRPAAQVRRRPVRHRDLGADGQAGRRHALEPVGRRPAGLHPAGRRRAACSSARRWCSRPPTTCCPASATRCPTA